MSLAIDMTRTSDALTPLCIARALAKAAASTFAPG
jgi:hypothetical protein